MAKIKSFERLINICVIGLCWLSFSAHAIEYEFESAEQNQQYERIVNQLRCVVCQNQTLAESNAPLAKDLREILVKQINLNQPDDDIYQYFLQRYGDFILYNPRLTTKTWFLWFGPALFFILAMAWYIRALRGHKT